MTNKLPEPPKFNEANKKDTSSPISVGDLDLPIPDCDLPKPVRSVDYSNLPAPIGFDEIEPVSSELEPFQSIEPAFQEITIAADLKPVQGDLRPVSLELDVSNKINKVDTGYSNNSDIKPDYRPIPKEIPKYSARSSPSPFKPKRSIAPLIVGAMGGLVLMIGGIYAISMRLTETEEFKQIDNFVFSDFSVPKIFNEGLTEKQELEIKKANITLEKSVEQLTLANARDLFNKRKFEESRVILEKILKEDSRNWDARVLLSQNLMELKNYQEALIQLEVAMAEVRTAETHLLKGKLLEYNGHHDYAFEEYKIALNKNESLHEARFLYARLLNHKGKYAEAEQHLYMITTKMSNVAEFWLEFGKAQRAVGLREKASESFKKALDLDESLTEAKRLLED